MSKRSSSSATPTTGGDGMTGTLNTHDLDLALSKSSSTSNSKDLEVGKEVCSLVHRIVYFILFY